MGGRKEEKKSLTQGSTVSPRGAARECEGGGGGGCGGGGGWCMIRPSSVMVAVDVVAGIHPASVSKATT